MNWCNRLVREGSVAFDPKKKKEKTLMSLNYPLLIGIL